METPQTNTTSSSNEEDALGRFHYLKKFSPWCIDKIFWDNGSVIIKGWYYSSNRSAFAIRCNGVRPIRHDYFRRRKDLPRLFPFWKEGSNSGFECEFLSESGKPLVFQREEDAPENEFLKSYYYLDNGLPIPPEKNIERVSGSTLRGAFLLEGYSAYRKIRHILETDLEVNLTSKTRILDWGCGCGRVSRYFVKENFPILGADVDPDNLSWSAANLGIDTILLNPDPSGKLPNSSFDLIIGISVMTHLDESLQLKWLDELYGTLAPGGYALLSTHGISSALRIFPENLFGEFLQSGFVDCGHNKILKEVVGQSEFYKDTFTSEEFVRKKWQRAFQVVKIYESIVGNNQDLVVLRKPN